MTTPPMNMTTMPSISDTIQVINIPPGEIILIEFAISVGIVGLMLGIYLLKYVLDAFGELNRKEVYLSIIMGLVISIWWKVWF